MAPSDLNQTYLIFTLHAFCHASLLRHGRAGWGQLLMHFTHAGRSLFWHAFLHGIFGVAVPAACGGGSIQNNGMQQPVSHWRQAGAWLWREKGAGSWAHSEGSVPAFSPSSHTHPAASHLPLLPCLHGIPSSLLALPSPPTSPPLPPHTHHPLPPFYEAALFNSDLAWQDVMTSTPGTDSGG